MVRREGGTDTMTEATLLEGVRRAARQRVREIVEERNRYRDDLHILLAVIHSDGGHHAEAVGATQSVEDAHQVWCQLVEERNELRRQRDEAREIACRLVDRFGTAGGAGKS